MAADLDGLLDRTAITPSQPVSPADVRATANRRTTRRRLAGGAGVALLVAAAVPLGSQLLRELPATPDPIVEPAPAGSNPVSFDVALRKPDVWTAPASQTRYEALRDGVPPSIANLPTEVRVPQVGPSVELPGGKMWVQGFGAGPAGRGLARLTPDCGDGVLCDGQYMEFLLLDQDRQIVLAHPFPLVDGGGGFGTSLDGSGALIGHSGSNDEEDVVVFRLGTTPGDRQVLVWPTENSPFLEGSRARWPLAADGESLELPAGWTVYGPDVAIPEAVIPGSDDAIDNKEIESLLTPTFVG